jgi:hypothetical protein
LLKQIEKRVQILFTRRFFSLFCPPSSSSISSSSHNLRRRGCLRQPALLQTTCKDLKITTPHSFPKIAGRFPPLARSLRDLLRSTCKRSHPPLRGSLRSINKRSNLRLPRTQATRPACLPRCGAGRRLLLSEQKSNWKSFDLKGCFSFFQFCPISISRFGFYHLRCLRF